MANLTNESLAPIVAQINAATVAVQAYVASMPAPVDDAALKAAVDALTAAVPTV